ncbi:MAG: hypothetical protein GC186_11140 [Rhodobacteraceae bacterium]|nr:hypothetical protein [Paracoccaceae bacterium]
MIRLRGQSIGIDQGSMLLFSDFADGGVMWSGTGPRECRLPVQFAQPFRSEPAVMVGISMWDLDQKTNQRADIKAEDITASGFRIVFRTWGDTRVARIRADWTAFGDLPDEDDWQLY